MKIDQYTKNMATGFALYVAERYTVISKNQYALNGTIKPHYTIDQIFIDYASSLEKQKPMEEENYYGTI